MMDAHHSPPTSTMSTRYEHFEDETDASSVSDYDSEWTQISGAEDGDSDGAPLTGGSDRPLSRDGTLDGSIDGDVWEGIVDDSASEYGEHREFTRLDELDATQDHRDSTAQSLSASAIATEDDRINTALNCSLMGTLRASRIRSASASLQGSMTESQSKLRLSFPDPLLRPRDDGSDSDPAPVTDDSVQETSDVHDENFFESEASSSPVVVENPPTLGNSEERIEEIESESVSELPTPPPVPPTIPSNAICTISLVLYGSAAASKWTVAEKIMKLALQTDFLPAPFESHEGVRQYILTNKHLTMDSHTSESISYAQIIDCTKNSYQMTRTILEGPTLALVLLPSSLPAVLPKHDLYLPLISTPALDFGSSIPALSSAFSEQIMKDSAQYAWNSVKVPAGRRVVLDYGRPDVILDVAELERLDQTAVKANFKRALLRSKFLINRHQRRTDALRVFPNKWYMFAFVATTLLAVTAGNRMRNLDKKAPSILPVIQTQNSTSYPAIMSSSESSGVPGGSAINSISLLGSTKDCAVTAVQTRSVALTPSKISGQTSLSLTSNSGSSASSQRISRKVEHPQPSQAGPSGSSTTSCSCHKKTTWADKLNVALDTYMPKDLMPLPDAKQGLKKVSSLSALLKERMVMSDAEAPDSSKASGKKPAKDVDIKALSLTIMDNAFSTVHSIGKSVVEAIGQDYNALWEAIDELLRALDRHLQTAKAGLGLATTHTKSEFAYRNERAKANAKKLRYAGERIFKAAGDSFRLGTGEAFKAFERVRGNVKKMRDDAGMSRRVRRARRREKLGGKERVINEEEEAEDERIDSLLDAAGTHSRRSDDTRKFREQWVGGEGDRKRMQKQNRKEARALKRERRRELRKRGGRIDAES